jgi:Clp protease
MQAAVLVGLFVTLPHLLIMILLLLLLLCMRLCQVSQMINKNMTMEEALARITGHSREKVRADLQRDFYLSAAEAVQYGIIDKVCCMCMMHRNLCTHPG